MGTGNQRIYSEVVMASLLRKLGDFARSPQGRELIAKGKRAAQDPVNQRKLRELRSRLTKKR